VLTLYPPLEIVGHLRRLALDYRATYFPQRNTLLQTPVRYRSLLQREKLALYQKCCSVLGLCNNPGEPV
jgi:hypothetical protein